MQCFLCLQYARKGMVIHMRIEGTETNCINGMSGNQAVYSAQSAESGSSLFSDLLKSVQESSQPGKYHAARSREVTFHSGGMDVPYGNMAKNGFIEYNGVTFVCDPDQNAICLGDVSDKRKTLNIGLSGGGVLKVNVDNLEELMQAIGMFSPEDINNILRAVSIYKKSKEIQTEMEAGINIGERSKEDREE